MVRRIDDGAAAVCDQPLGHVVVAACVLTVAVGDQRDIARVGVGPIVDVELSPRALELE
jgi:hypothetical protein